MYRESDHIHVIAITKATNVPVRVVYMDRSDQDETTEHNFPEDSTSPKLDILYRPGHYDILYHD
jgi:ubiquitin thioesterase protein OTUB1